MPRAKGAARRYLVLIQDTRGYAPPWTPREPAPPEGPIQPRLEHAVLAGDYEDAIEERDEALRLLANATDPDNKGDWDEAREVGWAFAKERSSDA